MGIFRISVLLNYSGKEDTRGQSLWSLRQGSNSEALLRLHIVKPMAQTAAPSPSDFPGIIRFLGYVPLPQPVTLAERLYYVRCLRGWSIKDASRAAGIHEETWGYWERGQNLPQKRMRERIEQFLALFKVIEN